MTKNNLDFCRFWLAIQVIFSHSFALAEGDERHEPLRIMTSGQLGSGTFAVNCFFAISGFLICHSWLRSQSAVNFFKKRVLRIYPGFVAAVLFGMLVVAPIGSEHFELKAHDLRFLPLNLIALRRTEPQGVFTNNPFPYTINGSLWSIPYEFKCYLGMMFIGSLGLLRVDRRVMLALLIGVATGCAVYQQNSASAIERGAFAAIVGQASTWCNVLPYFVAGTTYYLYRDRIPYSARFASSVFVAFLIASLVPPAGRFVFPFVITYLVFWFAFHSALRFHEWSRYGDFSYGIYLYGFPIQQLVALRFPGISPVSLFLVATPLAVIAGVLSWHLLEKHFLKRAKPVA